MGYHKKYHYKGGKSGVSVGDQTEIGIFKSTPNVACYQSQLTAIEQDKL